MALREILSLLALTVTAPPISYRPDTLIALETHACLGTCPVYVIQIESNGTATITGIQYTPSKGPLTVQVPRQKIDELSRAFTQANFCQLKDSYTSKGNSFISDIPGTYLSFRCGQQLKRVYDYYGTPAVVRDLEQQVGQAAQLERFLFADRQALENKFAAGLKPDSKEAQGLLLEAVQWKDKDLVKYLLDKGVSPETELLKTNYESRSAALVRAVLSNQVDIARMLVDYGADVRAATSPVNTTLLSEAARYKGSPEMLSALIEMGSDVNASDSGGSAPLIFAAMRGRPDLIESLLRAGADKNHKNSSGLSALDYAKQMPACGDYFGAGLNTVALDDDPDYTLCNRSKTIALLVVGQGGRSFRNGP